MPDPKLDNLKRWIESGQAKEWVDAHSGQWSYSDWVTYLDELKASPFWPMSPDDIGFHIESFRWPKAIPSNAAQVSLWAIFCCVYGFRELAACSMKFETSVG